MEDGRKPLRRITQPRPAAPERTASVSAGIVSRRLTLEPGRPFNAAMAERLAADGFAGGYVQFEAAVFEPFRYVIPALSTDPRHAAWYSETFAPEGRVRVEKAGAIVGRRHGAPFLHCHGSWTLPDGARRMGHVLPFDAVLAEPVEAWALVSPNALFEVTADEETNFDLFSPVRLSSDTHGEGRALFARVRSNEDLGLAVEGLCRDHDIGQARVHGIGSLIGATFEDGRTVASPATEVLIDRGVVERQAGGPRASFDISIVGIDGAIASGRLKRGDNPVCITFELVIEALG